MTDRAGKSFSENGSVDKPQSKTCIILGVQFAKAEKGEDRDIAKKKAINAGVSFGVIILLVVLLYAFRDTFVKLLSD